MKTHIRITPGVSQDKVRHLLEGDFSHRHHIRSWEGKGDGVSYKTVELTHDEELSDDAIGRLGEIGTVVFRT